MRDSDEFEKYFYIIQIMKLQINKINKQKTIVYFFVFDM